ncbi:TonB-dependent receptor [Novosphingobium resinovorum]|uniref:TonB-dependent receptor n=1 Tax=Novosphingobium resinovorum TaxID=158500 RepID=A0A1D8A0T8_9SPHN|nr:MULTISPECIES: TonB-dependent receptor [Novosphingobium]AOR75733.1 TonB-dependent receptor [Novosphingobium resinovorum]MBF7011085.1 TonB-dependent receptor [Novosphingobium sp. HR1a]WJM29073.1 TonB-dependent receptor [Novosphingobium resinovorum]
MNTFLRATTLALLGSSALAAVPAYAEEAPAAEAAADAEVGGGLDIMVTARRRNERIQDVPVAANAFGGEQLAATRTYNLRDLQQLTPSLVVTNTNPRNTSINIRGLGNNVSVYNDGLEPAVGVYVDQVYLARPGQAVFDLSDVERIEVLRGPQGTLFGKNTSAGAVVVTTKSPTFEPEAGGDVTFGNYDFRQIHAYASGALVDDLLAARLYVSKTDRDGYMTNRYDGSDTQDYHDFGLRGQLLFTPASNFKLRLIGDYGRQHSKTAAAVLTGVLTQYDNGTAFANNYYARAARTGYTPLPIDPSARQVDVDANPRYKMNQWGVTSIADLTIPGNTITSVTAYRAWNWYPHNDGDSTSLDAGTDFHQSNEQRQFSQELRIASEGTRKVDYVAGLYYLWQAIDAEALNAYGSDAAAWFVAPSVDRTAAAAALNGYTILGHSRPVTNSYAAFGQTIWHVTPTLDLTTGLRYTYETKTGWFEQTATGASLDGLTTAQLAAANTIRSRYGVVNSYSASTKEGRLSGSATLSWKVTPDALVYATYGRGHKFGGLNLANIVTTGAFAADPVIKPETIDSYELGVKTAWFGNRLTANLAAFWTDDSDYQTTVVDVERNNQSYFTNVGKVRTRGFEADLRANPAPWLSLYASGAFTDAKYVDYPNAPCPIEVTGQTTCDLSGRRLPGVSKWAASTGGEARQGVGSVLGRDSEVYLGADYSYRSDFNTTASLSRYSLIPGYSLVNARIGFRALDGVLDVQLWARNLTNKLYYLSLSAGTTGAVTGTLGDPRTYGVTLRTKF